MPAPPALHFESNLFSQSCYISDFVVKCRVFCKLSLEYPFPYETEFAAQLRIEGDMLKCFFVAACLGKSDIKWHQVLEAADFYGVRYRALFLKQTCVRTSNI